MPGPGTWEWPPCGPEPRRTGVVSTSPAVPARDHRSPDAANGAGGRMRTPTAPEPAQLASAGLGRGRRALRQGAGDDATGPCRGSASRPGCRVCNIVICDDQPELRDGNCRHACGRPAISGRRPSRGRRQLPRTGPADRSGPADPGRQHARRRTARREEQPRTSDPSCTLCVFSGSEDGKIERAMRRSGRRSVCAQDRTSAPLLKALQSAYLELAESKILT